MTKPDVLHVAFEGRLAAANLTMAAKFRLPPRSSTTLGSSTTGVYFRSRLPLDYDFATHSLPQYAERVPKA